MSKILRGLRRRLGHEQVVRRVWPKQVIAVLSNVLLSYRPFSQLHIHSMRALQQPTQHFWLCVVCLSVCLSVSVSTLLYRRPPLARLGRRGRKSKPEDSSWSGRRGLCRSLHWNPHLTSPSLTARPVALCSSRCSVPEEYLIGYCITNCTADTLCLENYNLNTSKSYMPAFHPTTLLRFASTRSTMVSREEQVASTSSARCRVTSLTHHLTSSPTQSGIQDVYILSAARTPVGSFGGSLKKVSGPQLGVVALKAALEKGNVKPEQLEEAYFGNVLQGNVGQAPARQVVIGAGCPNTTEATTINKVCASGMKAISLAAQSLALGQRKVMAAGGFESMSQAP